MNQAEEVKSRLDIVDVIREYINVKAAGANFKALCPFHNEKSPSFMISPEKQIYHCFGCGQGGDAISFVMEMEGLSFIEALRLLAPKAGVVLKETDFKQSSQRNRLLDLLALACDYYQRQLLQSRDVKGYLIDRGLDEKSVRAWRIGYSPDSWDDLLIYLKKKGFRDDEILKAGLSVKKDGGRQYNRFRDRVMFPLNNANGLVVGFTARINPSSGADEKQGKYINSPQTELYDKSKILFGLDRAKASIRSEDLAIIVEGQMDVISAHQHDFKNVIASSGTALTADQVRLIKRYTNNIAFAFDADQAGQMAADRGVRAAALEGMNIKVIVIPSGKDPDECIQKDPEEWKRAVREAKDVMKYFFAKIMAENDLEDAGQRKQARAEILEKIYLLTGEDRVEQDFWLKKLAQKIDAEEVSLRQEFSKLFKQSSEKRETTPKPVVRSERSLTREESMSELLLALFIKFPDLAAYIISQLELDYLAGEMNSEFYKSLIIYYNNTGSIEYSGLRDFLQTGNQNLLSFLDKLALLGDKDFYSLSNDQAKSELIRIIKDLKMSYWQSKRKELERLISQAEDRKDNDALEALLQELQELNKQVLAYESAD